MNKLLKNKIRSFTFFIIIIMSLSSLSFANNEMAEIKEGVFHVNVNNNIVKFDKELGTPYLLKETGRTIVPLRLIAEMMGYDVSWKKEPLMAFVSGNDIKIELEIGKNIAIVNGKTVPIEIKNGELANTKAILIPAKSSNRTYVPLRFIAENTEARVDYKQINGIHYIDIYTKDFKMPKINDNNEDLISRSILCYSSYIEMMKML